MKVALIDYGAGNLRSASKALEKVGAEVAITAAPEEIAKAERIVLPGVGAFADCMTGLKARPGLIEALRLAVLQKGKPFLGICVGMQLMASLGHEFGIHPGLDWIKGKILPLEAERGKIPHMGWNDVEIQVPHPLLQGLDSLSFYFVHSYYFVPEAPQSQLAAVDYGGKLAAMVGEDNKVGTQFHPEKSGKSGLHLLAQFLAWRP